MKLSFVVFSALAAIASSYPASDVKLDNREVAPPQIQLNDPKITSSQDETSKPNVADTFSKMSNCGLPCDRNVPLRKFVIVRGFMC
ncbi:uncharacterized protein DFL_002553 [Arthrobotrys flagrans]|uniref:Uncharacterized protein n=1 Tax=Arthrobotrys flagrans TaxID=97331 RepID=A0A437AB84_ARTFL|nr:hypothetical protein DFL_002553 [Arthrobotrys flagrans]